MSTLSSPPTADQDLVSEYLTNVFSAFRLGAWDHDQAKAEVAACMTRALAGDHTVHGHMEAVIRTLGTELGRRFGDFDPPADEAPGASHPMTRSQTSSEGRAIDLARHADSGGVTMTTLHLSADGSLRIARFDHGLASEAALGGDDHHWVNVAADHTPTVAFILLGELLRDRLDAATWLDQFCTRWRIPRDAQKAR